MAAAEAELLAVPLEEVALLELVTLAAAEVCELAAAEVEEEPPLLLPASIWAWTVALKVPVIPVKLKKVRPDRRDSAALLTRTWRRRPRR